MLIMRKRSTRGDSSWRLQRQADVEGTPRKIVKHQWRMRISSFVRNLLARAFRRAATAVAADESAAQHAFAER
eukprot:886922-Pleurochrysis_carterae.AAC.1